MCIDDIAACHYVSDIVLNQNLNADKIFHYSCEPYTKLLLGIQYVLLRREFRNPADWKRAVRDRCQNILVVLGGSDPGNFAVMILQALDRLKTADLTVKVVLGPIVYAEEALRRLGQEVHYHLDIINYSEHLIELMQWCDLAISASGSTVWELLALKTPMMIGVVAENQEPIARQLAAINAAENIGWFRDVSLEELSRKIQNMIDSQQRRGQLFESSQVIADTLSQGRERLLTALLSAG
jgi:UDP-2,4-diacetamido-2,4,6-trideoxy-beta-L-altropyranose hydrolase